MVDYAGVVLVAVAVLLAEALVKVFASGVWRRSRLVRALWLAGVLAALFAPLPGAPRMASLEFFAALIPAAVLGLVAASMVYSAMAYGVGFEQLVACRYERRRLAQHSVLWDLAALASTAGCCHGGLQCLLSAVLYSPTLYARLCRQAVEGAWLVGCSCGPRALCRSCVGHIDGCWMLAAETRREPAHSAGLRVGGVAARPWAPGSMLP